MIDPLTPSSSREGKSPLSDESRSSKALFKGREVTHREARSGDDSFHQFLVGVSGEKVEKILQKTNSVSEEEIKALSQALKTRQFNQSIFSDRSRYPYIALAALKKGLLNDEDLKKTLLFYAIDLSADQEEKMERFSELEKYLPYTGPGTLSLADTQEEIAFPFPGLPYPTEYEGKQGSVLDILVNQLKNS